MSSELDSVFLIGHFHPLLVHLPIGGLVVLGFLEVLAKRSRFKNAAQNSGLILGLVTGGANLAVLCGWVLSLSGHYDAGLLRWHLSAGSGVAVGCTVTFALNRWNRPRAYRVALGATLALLVVASHLGGSMTHGRSFLTRRTRAFPRSAPNRTAPIEVARVSGSYVEERLFADFARPILQEHCVACHGPEKQEADLRLDSLEALRKGGFSGPAFVAGNARESLMLQRLLLPLKDVERMPPDGLLPLTPQEIALLQWWIDHAAPQEAGRVGGLTAGLDEDLAHSAE